MKTISYECTSKDIIALAKQYMKSSKFTRLLTWFFRACVLFVVIVAIVKAAQSRATFRVFFVNALLSVLLLSITYQILRYFTIYVSGYVMSMGRGKGSKGKQHLHLLDSQLQNETKAGNSSTYYDGIYRVEETVRHLFIFTSDNTAHIIPKKQLEPEQFDDFKAYLREKLPPEVAYTEFK